MVDRGKILNPKVNDPYDPAVIASITDEEEAKAKAQYQQAEAGKSIDGQKPLTLHEEASEDAAINARHRETHTHEPSRPIRVVAEEKNLKKRWDTFKQVKGITEEVVLETPSDEEVRVVEETKAVTPTSLDDILSRAKAAREGTKPEEAPAKKIEVVTKKRRTPVKKRAVAKKKKLVVAKEVPKKLPAQKEVEKKQKKELSRREQFEKEPWRIDWTLSDIVRLEGMHPGKIRAYRLWFTELRRTRPGTTYEDAKKSLFRMGPPQRFAQRHASRRYASYM